MVLTRVTTCLVVVYPYSKFALTRVGTLLVVVFPYCFSLTRVTTCLVVVFQFSNVALTRVNQDLTLVIRIEKKYYWPSFRLNPTVCMSKPPECVSITMIDLMNAQN